MKNKINFYSLEQFILADAQDLQAHVFDYADDIGNYIIGENYTGALQSISRKSYNSDTETLILQPFRCKLGGILMKQVDDIPIDFSVADTLANAYYTSNGSMDNFDIVIKLWARVKEESIANETRNFWSPIDQASVQSDVDTRTQYTIDIKASVAKPAAVGDYEYYEIGEIATWLEVVNINTGQNRVVPLTITTKYAMNSYFSSIRIADLISQGLAGPFFAVESAMYNLLKNGQNDPATTDASPLVGGQPTYSLQGLAAFVGNNIHKLRAYIHFEFTPNTNWPANQEVDFNNLTTVAPYTEAFQVGDGTANPDHIGFRGTILQHQFDPAFLALPFDRVEVLQGTGALGWGGDVNMYVSVIDDNDPLDGPGGPFDITPTTRFGYHLKQGFQNLVGFSGDNLGGPITLLNSGGGIAWPESGSNDYAVTLWTNLLQDATENNRYDKMVENHFINYNGRVIDGYTSDTPPEPILRDTPTYISLPRVRITVAMKA